MGGGVMRYAIIEGDKIVNIVETSEEFAVSNGWIIAEGANIGDTWDGEQFIPAPPAPPAVPTEVTMRQARLALLSAGLLDAAQGVIDALPMPQRRAAQIEWEYALSVRRDHPLIALMISEGLATEAEVDGLFVAAAGLL